MHDRSRIRLGLLALVLIASCGRRVLNTPDAGLDGGGPGAGGSGPVGRGGAPATGQSGSGAVGRGGAAGFSIGGFSGGVAGSGGRGGAVGSGGSVAGRGGAVGSGGSVAGRGGAVGSGGSVAGRGGAVGSGGSVAGRGGAVGSGGVGMVGSGGVGMVGSGGTFGGRGGIGGGDLGRGGFAGTSDVAGRGGVVGRGGVGMVGSGGVVGSGGTLGGRGGSGGSGGTGGGICLTCRATVLPVSGRDVVYSASRNELYVSVPGVAETYPNTIVVVDPSTSSVLSAIPIGSDPGALALSDDGTTLWVAIDGAHAFRKVTMTSTSPVVGPLIHFPKARPDSFFTATSMAVLAGAPLQVAVALSDDNFYNSDVRLFDDGVQRGPGTGSNNGASILTAGPAGLVFGAANSGIFLVYRASSSGLVPQTHFGLLRGISSDIVYLGGRVITNAGDAIDVSNPTTPKLAGVLPYVGPVAARDPMTVMMLTSSGFGFPFNPRAEVRLFSNVLLQEFGLAPVPANLGPANTTYQNLVYAGGDAVAFFRNEYNSYGSASKLVVMHDPTFGTPIGGGGGTGGGGTGGTGGTGGVPDPCPGCTFTTIPAYGRDMEHDPTRNLIYVASDASAPSHPSSIVTVDPTAGTVVSLVPVGNDPQGLALSDDASALWVALAGERRVRRMTPGATPVPGPVYSLPMLLTTGEPAAPFSLVVLPGTTSSIAVNVYGPNVGGRGVFILDDGQPRANFIQPPEVGANFLVNGPPGYLFAVGDNASLMVLRLGTVGATLESHLGFFNNYYQIGFVYSSGYGYAANGAAIDLTNPDAPLPAGRFPYSNCSLGIRSPTRLMMVCPNPNYGSGPILRMLDTTTFTQVGSVTLPNALPYQQYAELKYIGGDAVAMLGYYMPLQIMRAPIIGAQP